MTVEGIVKNGKIVLKKPSKLAEGETVTIRPKTARRKSARRSRARGSASEFLLRFAGKINDPSLPSDLSTNHDHYLYGVPKNK